MSVHILDEKDYTPSTVTMVARLNKSIKTEHIAEYLPVTHLFSKGTGKRVKLDSGTRKSIEFFGYEGIIISVCYKKIRRGMRTGAMNNMISADLQYQGKNIHVKISSTTLVSVGTPGYEFGFEVFKLMTSHLNMLNSNAKYIKELDRDVFNRTLKWIFENCVDEKNMLLSLKEMLVKVRKCSDVDERMVKSCAVYADDFEKMETDKFREKITKFCDLGTLFDDDISFYKPSIFNSVFHIYIFKDQEKRKIPLHRLAPYFAEKNFSVEFHNWTSEGVNICFDIEEEKLGSHHKKKEYKHRFTIHIDGNMRQCSPTFKEESYRYYLGVVKQIEKFFEEEETQEYLEYIKTSADDVRESGVRGSQKV